MSLTDAFSWLNHGRSLGLYLGLQGQAASLALRRILRADIWLGLGSCVTGLGRNWQGRGPGLLGCPFGFFQALLLFCLLQAQGTFQFGFFGFSLLVDGMGKKEA